jgi:hypothetical protein
MDGGTRETAQLRLRKNDGPCAPGIRAELTAELAVDFPHSGAIHCAPDNDRGCRVLNYTILEFLVFDK